MDGGEREPRPDARLVRTDVGDVLTYSRKVDVVMATPDEYVGRQLRVEGQLRQGSIEFQNDPSCEHRFVLMQGDLEMPVRFPRCVVPDTFRDVPGMDVGVTVEGELQADDSIEATQVLAKCPSKYEMKQKAASGEKAPHAMGGPAEAPSPVAAP